MRQLISFLTFAIVLIGAAACTENNSNEAVIKVRSTADACEVSASEASSGNVVFEVTNDASEVTEFYLLADDGLRIVGEVENIGPGTTRKLVVEAAPGNYFTACKPRMVGAGIRAPFTVTEG